MSTIDDLDPATSASDSDELIVSQAGVTRKITRALLQNGLQAQVTLPSQALLGRASPGMGAVETLGIGQNLVLTGSTLSASAAPFVIANLGNGNVPVPGDVFAVSQAGTNVAVTFGQLVNGLSSSSGLDISRATVTPTGSATQERLADFAASALTQAGGSLTGALFLSANPSVPGQAANKIYVDTQIASALPRAGGSMSGALTLASVPRNPLDAATKSYVDSTFGLAVPLTGASMTGAVLLFSDPAVPAQAATKRYADTKVARTGDTLTGPLTLAADPATALQAATKSYVDGTVSRAVSKSGDTLNGLLSLAATPTLGAHAAPKQYVDQRVLRSGDTLTGALTLAADPSLPSQAATKNYVDKGISLLLARAGATMSGALILATDPSVGLQASTKQYVDLRVLRNGDSMTGMLSLASDPAMPLQASTKQYVDNKFTSGITSGGGTLTGPLVLAGNPAAPLQATTKQYADQKIARSGDTLTGALILASDPVAPAQAATKNYADALAATRLPLVGGSLTGYVTLSADPSVPLHAASKRYVDALVATALPLSGGTVSGSVSLAAAPTSAQHAATKQYVDSQFGSAVLSTGASMAGPLLLAGPPTSALGAATKAYVDANPDRAGVLNVARPPFGAALNGVTDDTAAFKAAYIAAPVGGTIYVPNGTTVLQQPGTWGVALTKFVKWIIDGTVLANGTPLGTSIPGGVGPASLVLPGVVTGSSLVSLASSQGASQSTDFAVSQSSYIVNHSGGQSGAVATNHRNDTIIYASPGNFIWGGLDRLLWAGTQTPSAATPAQHVGRYVQTIRLNAAKGSNGQPLPQPQLWAACLEYRDTTGQPSSVTNAALTIEMDWFGNGLDDANTRAIQSLVIGQHDTTGAPVEVSSIIGAYLAAGSSGSAKTVIGVGVPFSNAVLDTTYAAQINNAPVLKMAAGQAIAFEATNSNRLLFDSPSNTLRWNQGTLSYPVGKGLTVGWVNVYSSSSTLPNYISGNLIVLTGSGSFAITLPSAATVAAGTGYTFTVTGTCAVSIVPGSGDTIDNGPIVLRPNDRYHIVSDGSSAWHDIFRSNSVSPRFAGPLVLASYTVAGLPSGMVAGAKAFASNGRKPGEAAGSGSGVEAFFDGQRWISSCSGSAVAA